MAGEALDESRELWGCPAALVTVKRVVDGRLKLFSTHLRFDAASPAEKSPAESPAEPPAAAGGGVGGARRTRWRWLVRKLETIHLNRYLLQYSALELFMDDRSSCFLNFPSKTAAAAAAARIASARPGLALLDRRHKAEAAERARERWQRREMTNFEYLMLLNTLAGRTYSDLAQYPVMPWVIADYESKTLDLGAPGALRDLAWPVGALNPARHGKLRERFESLAEAARMAPRYPAPGDPPPTPPFHHGSHYSTAGSALFWLLRLAPFARLARELQGGHFDHADRLFHSVPGAWAGCLSNPSDVKVRTGRSTSLVYLVQIRLCAMMRHNLA